MSTELQNEETHDFIIDSGDDGANSNNDAVDKGQDQDHEQNQDVDSQNDEKSESDLAADNKDEGQKPGIDENSDNGDDLSSQESVQKVINRKHYQYNEEKRQREKVQAELEALREKYEPQNVVRETQEVPEIPDVFDDNFDQAMKERDRIIAENAKISIENQVAEDRKKEVETRKQQESEAKFTKIANEFDNRAKQQGIDLEGLRKAESIVTGYGISQDLAMHLLNIKDGPVIVQALAADSATLERISNADPFEAAEIINTLRSSKNTAKFQQSKTPAPAKSVSGRGTKSKGEGPEGATYT